MRWAVASGALAVIAGCLDQHNAELTEVDDNGGDCATCHFEESTGVEDPPHVGVLPPDCGLCHNEVAWSPAEFSHDAVSNPCIECHALDYENTADPPHPGLYPQTCVDCHQTDAWRPALDGAHPNDAFPIDKGPHDEYACVECHDLERGSSTAGENTDCIGCHEGEHTLDKMNDKHSDEPDYDPDPGRPNFCLDCHPDGGDAEGENVAPLPPMQ